MNRSIPGSVPARKLIYVPIIHSQADMGTFGTSVQRTKLVRMGRQRLAQNIRLVEAMWEQIERVVDGLTLTAGKTRVYQDGLPVCGQEEQIVSELAGAGSRNHRLLMKLQARGALLMGTESPELLMEEYRAVSAALSSSRPGQARSSLIQAEPAQDTLLERRDRYIADRISTTLEAGETGILFLGMFHDVRRYLAPDIRVVGPTPNGRQEVR